MKTATIETEKEGRRSRHKIHVSPALYYFEFGELCARGTCVSRLETSVPQESGGEALHAGNAGVAASAAANEIIGSGGVCGFCARGRLGEPLPCPRRER